MHSIEGSLSNVPAFLVKLWKLVEDPSCDHLIKWGNTETSFIIRNQAEFSKELLPLYFKHNNMASFIRQLNMYGFRKVTNITKSGLHNDNDDIEFHHPCFAKNRKELLSFIKRKTPISSGKSGESVNITSNSIQDILANVKVLQVNQENVDSLLSSLAQENEALWREIALLRQKHAKQQQIVAKLIQFLLTIVQPTSTQRKILKRKLPLMIHEGKSVSDNQLLSQKIQKVDINLPEQQSLVIRDVTDHLDKESLFSPSNHSPCPSTSQFDTTENPLVESVDSSTSPVFDINVNPSTPLEQLSILEPLQSSDELADPNQVDSQLLEILQPEIQVNETITLDDLPEKSLIESPVLADNEIIAKNINNEDNQPLCAEIASNTNKQIAIKDQVQPTSLSSFEPSISKMENLSKNSFTEHLEYIDNELSWLYDQLSGEQMNTDPSSLLALFNADDNVDGNELSENYLSSHKPSDEVVGNELIQYPTSSLDPELWDEESLQDLVTDTGNQI